VISGADSTGAGGAARVGAVTVAGGWRISAAGAASADRAASAAGGARLASRVDAPSGGM
jgi:hypothetical protein